MTTTDQTTDQETQGIDDAPAQAGAVPDPAAETGTEPEAIERHAATAEELGRDLLEARARADENYDQLLRARAEIENLRRRQAAELEKAHKFALDKFVSELLAVRDSLELGRGAAQEEGVDVAKLREGTELTLKLLTDVMGKFGVEQVDPEGQPFDPGLHQAIQMQPSGDVPPNTVVAVIQKGYTLNGRLVRPAMVMVSSAG